MSATENTNPGNFANRPTEEVKEIAAMGGKASHGPQGEAERKDSAAEPARNPDGTFTKGSEAAKAAGHVGGMHSHNAPTEPARNPDGTFTKGSEAAKAAGHVGGMHSHDGGGLAKQEAVSELEVQDDASANGPRSFDLPGSEAAKEAGHKGGMV
ncbi:hypothetical protein B0A50_08266 [Salinomyces thailandicus]|uniref:Uncharacterized protein n=1 Tax=Salinomyces thailandicus TaxID=706561 RepID=A0A4U0TKK8_9PEZI|nr:hypothetical protein B0A50_08266 [Salinomyces thailandica]